jgi:hypothetical protein
MCQKVNNHIQSILDQAIVTQGVLEEKKEKFDDFFQRIVAKANECQLDDIPQKFQNNNLDSSERNNRRRLAAPSKEIHENVDYNKTYKDLYNCILDRFISEILDRFEPKNLEPLITIFNLLNDKKRLLSDEKLKNDFKIYEDLININKLYFELDLFYRLKEHYKLETFENLIEFLRSQKQNRENFSSFKNIYILLKIYLTSPIANVSSERGFSCLKRVKTYLRSTMVQERLSSLAILNLESEMINLIDIEEVITEFSSKLNRNLNFY